MKSFIQWIATVLTVGVFLTLSFCGMTMSPAVIHAGTMIDAVGCLGDGCGDSTTTCLTQCIQRLDRAQQSLVAEVVAIIAVGILFIAFLDRLCTNIYTTYFWAHPWKSHRLFALRE